MTSSEFDVHRILIVDNPANPRHRRIDQTFLLAQRASILSVGKRARVGEETHVADGEVAAPGDVDVAVVVEVRAAHVAVDTDGTVALGLPSHQLRVSDVL